MNKDKFNLKDFAENWEEISYEENRDLKLHKESLKYWDGDDWHYFRRKHKDVFEGEDILFEIAANMLKISYVDESGEPIYLNKEDLPALKEAIKELERRQE